MMGLDQTVNCTTTQKKQREMLQKNEDWSTANITGFKKDIHIDALPEHNLTNRQKAEECRAGGAQLF